MTLKELASQAELTEAHISKVERGISAASIASLDRIAEALGVSLTLLISDQAIQEPHPFTRGNVRRLTSLAPGITYEELIPVGQEGPLSAALFNIAPESGSGDDSIHHGYEFRFVLEGTLTYYLDGTKHELQSGDSFFADGNVPHRWVNDGSEDCRVIVVATMPMSPT